MLLLVLGQFVIVSEWAADSKETKLNAIIVIIYNFT